MSQKYKAKGIILKGSSIKENDRLVTVLTPEYGVIRAVAPGAKKHKSSLRGRTQLFVVNDLLLIRGKSLDKLIQADTVYTYPGLSRDLGKLASAQYLAELCLFLAVDEQPQAELYELLIEHLSRIERADKQEFIYPYLAQAVFHLIAIAGLTPQVFNCCLTQREILPNLANGDRLGFSYEGGGIIDLTAWHRLQQQQREDPEEDAQVRDNNRLPKINDRLSAEELAILQELKQDRLPTWQDYPHLSLKDLDLTVAWIRVEKILREYIQYHIGRTIRSANLVESLYVEF